MKLNKWSTNTIKKIRLLFKLNLLKTLKFNFTLLPFKIAMKLPVYIYGKMNFSSLNGKLQIETPITRGMIKFGSNLEIIKSQVGCSELCIDGCLVVKGNFQTGLDCIIIILKDAVLQIGENSYIGSRTKIICSNNIVLGKYIRFGFESQIIDSNFHYVKDLRSNKVVNRKGKVIINDYCWIGNRCSIMKGTITPTYFIISSNSLCNKDYSRDLKSYSMVGGVPAKLLKEDCTRIYDSKEEARIDKLFENTNMEEIVVQ